MKYLFWLLLILVVIFFYRNAAANAQRARMQDRSGNTANPRAQAKPERSRRFGRAGNRAHKEGLKTITMVQCEHCLTHLPEDEALIRYGHAWCNAEHERLGPNKTRV